MAPISFKPKPNLTLEYLFFNFLKGGRKQEKLWDFLGNYLS